MIDLQKDRDNFHYLLWSDEDIIKFENETKNNDEAINRILENHNQLFSKLLNRIVMLENTLKRIGIDIVNQEN